MNKVNEYFNGDSMAADAWSSKYQMKDPSRPNVTLEHTPADMHWRLATEFAEVEYDYINKELANDGVKLNNLSQFGQALYWKRSKQVNSVNGKDQIREEFYHYFDFFKGIVPQGSIMSNLGNKYVFGSLSNCFGIAPPLDSYGGIMMADQHLVQLMKRRGGVGTHLNNIRPTMAKVTNASKSSTGVPSYAERYSNTTREVAQEGRRGALMLLLTVKHPDIFRFVTMKEDRTKVTGANVSVMFTDTFLEKVESDSDFLCVFPTEIADDLDVEEFLHQEYNALYEVTDPSMCKLHSGKIYTMRIRAKELFQTFVDMAHSNAEPGAAFIDRIIDYSPDGVYEAYVPELCNPCGEQWFHRNDTCRLIAENLFGIVKNPFTDRAEIDFERLYELSYMQQRLGDNLVDLEAIYINRILDKIVDDPEPMEVKQVELKLWNDIKDLALSGRRTGNGFTALGDMLAALLKPYFSPEIIEAVMKCKMKAELDATIDMAILRGPFVGWDRWKEFKSGGISTKYKVTEGRNSFFQMILEEFPEQAERMFKWGRRNVSWSTVAPTGTVSLMCQTTSGVEPMFKPWYIRRKKINPSDANHRVDFVDDLGDKWQHYFILHPKFADWMRLQRDEEGKELVVENMDEAQLEYWFHLSPWYGSLAEDLTWQQRIEVNAIVQKYTTNSISCTVNLPENISKDVVYNLYFQAWKAGLKGITVYREGSRSGVLVSSVKQINIDEFGYIEPVKRPETLEAELHYIKYGGKDFAVIVGLLNNNPFELFAFANPSHKENVKGSLIKVGSQKYKFVSENYTVEDVQLADHPNERILCRLASNLLRYRMSPKYVVEQIEKADVLITHFGKAIQRVLKTYVPNEEVKGEACENCGEHTMVYEEGCKKCSSCGHSKC